MGGETIMKLFVVSDIHGHADQLKAALKEAAFDPDDPSHLFISCGDLFDRGRQNRAVLRFTDRLTHKVLIRGNHEDTLEKALLRRRLTETDLLNGTDITVEEFFGRDAITEGLYLYPDHRDEADVTAFLDSMVDYFETRHYIFVHGWLPIRQTDEGPAPHPDWRNATADEWRNARWLEWHKLYPNRYTDEEKTVVCGHRSASYGRKFDKRRSARNYKPFHRKGIIAIDACTVISGCVNLLVLEDCLL